MRDQVGADSIPAEAADAHGAVDPDAQPDAGDAPECDASAGEADDEEAGRYVRIPGGGSPGGADAGELGAEPDQDPVPLLASSPAASNTGYPAPPPGNVAQRQPNEMAQRGEVAPAWEACNWNPALNAEQFSGRTAKVVQVLLRLHPRERSLLLQAWHEIPGAGGLPFQTAHDFKRFLKPQQVRLMPSVHARPAPARAVDACASTVPSRPCDRPGRLACRHGARCESTDLNMGAERGRCITTFQCT